MRNFMNFSLALGIQECLQGYPGIPRTLHRDPECRKYFDSLLPSNDCESRHMWMLCTTLSAAVAVTDAVPNEIM